MPVAMLASVHSCALFGVDAFPVVVEVDVTAGNLPAYHVVGLPAVTVKEGAHRIRSALDAIAHKLPNKKVTVNLAPADRRKEGAALDLPIAVAVLLADRVGSSDPVDGLLIVGELGLDGSLRPIRGALAAALLARECGMRGVLMPAVSAAEASAVDDLEIYQASHLGEVVAALQGERELCRHAGFQPTPTRPASYADMCDVRGQAVARAGLEVAVAGGHNFLMIGPPGIGKTMLARRIPSILPPMSRDESLETTKVFSALGLANGGLIRERPFRAPHHSISRAALVGGGAHPRPGEISLANNGVLFLDEVPEFGRGALEALRQPLEDRIVTVDRVQGSATMPASFLLVASANPCPCGWLGSRDRVCICSPSAVERYRRKLSGPLVDRIDLQVFVPNVPLSALRGREPGEASAAIRDRVQAARDRQAARLSGSGYRTNAEMSSRVLRATCRLDAAGERTLARLHRARKGMTARTVDRIIKVARTIADLTGLDEIDAGCLREAASYRALDSEPALDSRLLAGFAKPSEDSSATRQSAKASSSTT